MNRLSDAIKTLTAIACFALFGCGGQGSDSGLSGGSGNVVVKGIITSSVNVPEGLAQTAGQPDPLSCQNENFTCSTSLGVLAADGSEQILASNQLIVNLLSCDSRPANGSEINLGSFTVDPDQAASGLAINCSCMDSDGNIIEEFFLNFSGDTQVSLGQDGRAEAICGMSSFFDLASGEEAQAFALQLGCGGLLVAKAFLDDFCEDVSEEDPGFICGEIAESVSGALTGLECPGNCERNSCAAGCEPTTEVCDEESGCCISKDTDCGDFPSCEEGCGKGQICDENTQCCIFDNPCRRAPAPELDCTDECDNDNDGPVDCADPDCAADPACAVCGDGDCTGDETSGSCPQDCHVCGNGVREGPEGCDDGNQDSGDGCDQGCVAEFCHGFEAEPNDSDFDQSNYAGCASNELTLHAAMNSPDVSDWFALPVFTASDLRMEITGPGGPGTCPGDQLIIFFGPDRLALSEDNDSGTDLCPMLEPSTHANLRGVRPGVYYLRVLLNRGALPVPSYLLKISYLSTCGDGTVQGSEQCDDGDVASGDGCDRFCRIEIAPPRGPTRRIAFVSQMALNGSNADALNFSTNLWVVYEDGIGLVPLTHYQQGSTAGYGAGWSPDGSQIAFHSNAALDGRDLPFPAEEPFPAVNIWVIDSDGFNMRALTEMTVLAAGSLSPQYSPNGTKILFTSARDLGGGDFSNPTGNENIWIMNSDGSGELPLTNLTDPPFGVFSLLSLRAWSPDGSKIVFASPQSPLTGNIDNRARVANIWTMNPDGSSPVSLTFLLRGGIETFSPMWSPDGLKIGFTSNRAFDGSDNTDPSGRYNLWTMNADGSSPIPLTETINVSNFPNDWSPDGSLMVFESIRHLDGSDALSDNFLTNLWTVPADGSGLEDPLTELTNGNAYSSTAQYSPLGDKIVFNSGRAFDGSNDQNANATNNIWIMNSDGSTPQPLTRVDHPNGHSANPAWEP